MGDLRKLAVIGVLIVAAATGVLGRLITPAANWFGHHEAKMITKQFESSVTPAPSRH